MTVRNRRTRRAGLRDQGHRNRDQWWFLCVHCGAPSNVQHVRVGERKRESTGRARQPCAPTRQIVRSGRARLSAEPDARKATAETVTGGSPIGSHLPPLLEMPMAQAVAHPWAITAGCACKEHWWRHDSPNLRTFMGALRVHSNWRANLASP
jgi:hypothetical protein